MSSVLALGAALALGASGSYVSPDYGPAYLTPVLTWNPETEQAESQIIKLALPRADGVALLCRQLQPFPELVELECLVRSWSPPYPVTARKYHYNPQRKT